MKKIFTFILLVIALVAMAQNTTRRLKAAPAGSTPAAAIALYDTITTPDMHAVDINGYDKPLRSRRETFFATNNCPGQVAALVFTVNYNDINGRQLHSRQVRVPVDIPSGDTRQVAFKSWDEQLSFYYRNSTAPTRVSQATPYDISIAVDTIFILAGEK